MCCIFASFALIGPRLGLIIWWLLDPLRFAAAFPSIFWPIIGLIFAPWTTAAYVLVGLNGVTGLDWIWIIIAILLDISSYGSGAYSRRQRPAY